MRREDYESTEAYTEAIVEAARQRLMLMSDTELEVLHDLLAPTSRKSAD